MVAGPLDAVDVGEDALVGRRVPELFRLTSGRIAHPERHRVAASERCTRQAGHLLRDARRRRLIALPLAAAATLAAGASAALCAPAGLRRRIERRTVRHADAAASLLALLTERQSRPADERDAPAVVRPGRARVAIDVRRHVLHRARRDVVDADEAVVCTVAHERNLPAVRRPARRAVRAPRSDERLLTSISRRCGTRGRHTRAKNLTVASEQHRRPVGRKLGRRALRDSPRRSARGAHGPDRALCAIRIACRIRDPAIAVWRVAPHEHHGRSVVGDADVAEIGAVVFQERGEAHGLIRRRDGGVDVAFSLVVRNPRQPVGFSCRHEIERVGGTEILIDARCFRCLRLGHDDQSKRQR